MIAWRYLDKEQATIRALQDYENMTCIIEMTPEKLKALDEDNDGIRSSWNAGSIRNTRNLNQNEDRILQAIGNKDVVEQRYKLATEFMNWFKPAWDSLSEEEQIILTELFLVKGNKSGAIERLSIRLFVDRSNVYRKKDKALEHLTVLLFGY